MAIPNTEAGSLIRRARAGSGSSLGTLLDGYREFLLRIANDRIDPRLRTKLAPSDLVQGSMLVATRDFQQFRGDSEQEFRAWLLRIVTTQLVDGFRQFIAAEKRRSDREVNGAESALKRVADNGESPSTLASLNEDATKLLETIEALPEALRDVVQARYLGGLTFPQIAERLEMPVTTCRRRWLEAIEAIGGVLS